MNWFFELTWLWKSLGIALLVSLAGVLCAHLVCRSKGTRLSAGIVLLIAAAAFAAALVVILLLAQTPAPI